MSRHQHGHINAVSLGGEAAASAAQNISSFSRRYRVHWLLSFLLAVPMYVGAPVFGQDQRLSQMLHTSWTGRNGAPQDINALAQTPDGMLWIGSTGGLFTFDGITFSPFRPQLGSPPLPFSPVASLLVSKNGDLWVEGIYERAVARISHGQITTYGQLEDGQAARLSNLQQAPDGSIWAIVDDFHIIRLGSDNIWHHSAKPKSGVGLVTGLFFDSAGVQWVVQDQQLYKAQKERSTFIAASIRTTSEVAFRQDSHQGLWIFGEHHNADIQPKGAERIDVSHSYGRHQLPLQLNTFPINDVVGTKDGYLWLAIPGKGVVRAKLEELTGSMFHASAPSLDVYSVNDGLSSKQPTALYQDASGNVWVGGGRGLDRFTPSHLLPAIGGAEEGAWSTCTNPFGEVWIASDKGDLWVSRDGARKLIYKAPAIYKLYCGRKGDVWFIDRIGLIHFYKGHLSRMPPLPRPPAEVTVIWEFVALLELGDLEQG